MQSRAPVQAHARRVARCRARNRLRPTRPGEGDHPRPFQGRPSPHRPSTSWTISHQLCGTRLPSCIECQQRFAAPNLRSQATADVACRSRYRHLHRVKAPCDQDATLLAGNSLEQEDMRALRRQPQDCADRTRVPPSEPDYGNMSLDDAAPQAAKALVTAASPSITNCELTNVKASLAYSFYDSHFNFNCVIARIPCRTHLSTHQQPPAPAPGPAHNQRDQSRGHLTLHPSFAANLVRAGYPYRHSSRHAPRGLR